MAKTKLITLCNKLPWVISAFFTANFLGALVFALAEKVNYFDSVYWAFITSLSVGYGDYSPETFIGKLTAVALAATVLLVIVPLLVGIFVTKTVEDENEFNDTEQKRHEAKLDAILRLYNIDPTAIDKEFSS
jgi:voltage-gated potassium channel